MTFYLLILLVLPSAGTITENKALYIYVTQFYSTEYISKYTSNIV